MKTLDVTGLSGDRIALLLEVHMGWYAEVKSPIDTRPGTWEAKHPQITITSSSIAPHSLRKLVNYDFAIEGQLYVLKTIDAQTRHEHGSGYPGDTGTTLIPEIRIVFAP